MKRIKRWKWYSWVILFFFVVSAIFFTSDEPGGWITALYVSAIYWFILRVVHEGVMLVASFFNFQPDAKQPPPTTQR